jgi:hypothetical protein
MGMTTTPLPTLTPLPVLVKSSDHLSVDGAGHLFSPQDPDISGLHLVSKKEAFSIVDEWRHANPEQWNLVNGIALFQQALRGRDWADFQKAWAHFQNALDLVQRWVPHWSDAEIAHIRGSKKWKEAAWAYSGLMSNLLQKSRFIIWYSPKDERHRPGLYCPDWELAVFAIVGMDHIRFCKKPGCGKPFIPRFISPNGDRDNEQKYCPGGVCANAHRVAQWKAKHPERAKVQRRKKTARKSLR